MKSRLLVPIIIVLILLSFSGCSINEHEPETPSFTFSMCVESWDILPEEHMRYQCMASFLSDVEHYFRTVSAFIGRENWYDDYNTENQRVHVEIKLIDGVSHVRHVNQHLFELYLNQMWFIFGLAPTAHEVAHVVEPAHNRCRSLSEGMASYLQDKFGSNPSLFNWGMDPHALTNLLRSVHPTEFEQIRVLMGSRDNARQQFIADLRGLESRRLFYVMSQSFVTYLVETYGIENVMNVINSVNLQEGYYSYFGKRIEDVRDGWLAFLEEYHTISAQEHNSRLRELFAEHNMSDDLAEGIIQTFVIVE